MPTGRPLSTFHPGTYSAAYVEFQFGDACPFLDRPVKISCEQVFAALPWREELEYELQAKLFHDLFQTRPPSDRRAAIMKFRMQATQRG